MERWKEAKYNEAGKERRVRAGRKEEEDGEDWEMEEKRDVGHRTEN